MTKVKEKPQVKEGAEQLSEKEIAERRKKITKYYQDQIEHLKVQLEYEELMTSIEESRAKRLQAQAFLAQAFGEPTEEEQLQPKKTLSRK